MSTVASANFPLRPGSVEDFARARDFFHRATFHEPVLCRAFGITDMSDLGRVGWDKVRFESLSPQLRWCIDFFARGLSADEQESRTICGETFEAFEALGLVSRVGENSSRIACPAWLYPVGEFIVASDRCTDPEGRPYTPSEDVVFPAIYAGTLRFLRLLPEGSGAEALDVCGGSGIGALVFAKTARVAATADLTERSALFAEFNARLNGARVESLCGDLYEPAQGRKFDIISAHPPFVPSTGQTMVYRDGGDNGEAVTRRVIEGLPAHLRPGGMCVILCVACDTDKTFEQRAHDWLGEHRDEFDIVFGLEKILSVEEVVESMRKRGAHIGEEGARQLLARLRSFGTRQFVYGALVMRRYAERIAAKPLRVQITPEAGAGDFERLLKWRQHCRQPGLDEWLLQSRPRFAARLLLTARHVVQGGALVPAEFVFSIESGPRFALRPDAWVVPILARLEGEKSVREIFEAAQSAEELPKGFSAEAFAELVRLMIERGLLEVDLPKENGRAGGS
ncbi:MAG TPA: methyltransferase [Verrucomicrobiae bacterium]|jgi:SAM-dependent methyltransferase|nr:methyltransferase [Verrucomicrobiae bacterium]